MSNFSVCSVKDAREHKARVLMILNLLWILTTFIEASTTQANSKAHAECDRCGFGEQSLNGLGEQSHEASGFPVVSGR